MKNERNASIRHRIFNVVFLVGMFMSFSSSLMNYLLGLGTAVVLITFICGVITVGLYIIFKITGNYNLVSLIVVIMLSFVFSQPCGWLTGNLWQHPILHAGKCRDNSLIAGWVAKENNLFLFALVIGFLLVIEFQRPELIAGYDSGLIRYIDLSFGFFVCMFSLVVLIAALTDSYMGELRKSEQYLAALEEKNKEIEAKNRMLEKSNAELIEAKEKAEKLNQLLYEEKQKLQKLSITDYLTGAFNKRFITACLEEEIEASRNKQTKLTVAMIDIDNFKNINDTYGHLYGDYVVERVARTIINNLRQTDVLGRYGGDEFLIIMRNTSREEGYVMLERIRQKILELEWENDLVVTISGGVIEVGSDELTGLLNKADRLLYKAKNKSKNLIEKEVGG